MYSNKLMYSKRAAKCKYFSSINSNYDTSRSFNGSFKPRSCYSCTNFISQKCTVNISDVVDEDNY